MVCVIEEVMLTVNAETDWAARAQAEQIYLDMGHHPGASVTSVIEKVSD